ncbi:DUF3011 domain-containing protein [Luteimonas gilva]|uniref:DUF3011 domain-containing protein n=1 Tax=Luteimonas gilva TaxID=2572684 RepID=A0A4U5JZ81_9GAMM|nr:DUF3011 domain-containing protein [Luteimonas gilva]TKR34158.1 DUF3011 domain-containing protein [Luteimonas gilva]
MKRLLDCALLAFGLSLLAVPVHAQMQQRAYAPENLRTLPYNDQVRVISLEYQEQSRGRRIPDDQLRFYLDQVNRSNWTFSRIKQDISQSLGHNNGGPQPPYPGNGQRIRCESVNNRSQTCPTPWRGDSRLVRQLSGTACEEGRTWQSQRGQVYVGGGCRAEFEEAPYDPGHGIGGSIRCESTNGRPNTCRTPWAGPSRLVRQISGSACDEGRTWFSQRGQVSVSGGCRAEFAPGRGGGGGGNPNYSVTCSSVKMRPTTCAWDSRNGRPYLQQQLSGSACVEGRTWGYDGNRAIWVNGGCSGRFASSWR